MHIGNSNLNFKYYMDNNEFEMVQEEKDLGVLIISLVTCLHTLA